VRARYLLKCLGSVLKLSLREEKDIGIKNKNKKNGKMNECVERVGRAALCVCVRKLG